MTTQVYATQGGGKVKWDDQQQWYVFTEAPEDFPEMEVGDLMPSEWSIVPI